MGCELGAACCMLRVYLFTIFLARNYTLEYP